MFVEQYDTGPRRRFVDGVNQDQPGYFSGRAAYQVDGQAYFQEDHLDVAKVVVVGWAVDGSERRDGGNELGGNVIC